MNNDYASIFMSCNLILLGMAYFHDEQSTIISLRGPYWLSGFNCTGDEPNLLNCSHNSRLNLGNCSKAHIAAVLCYNDSGMLTQVHSIYLIINYGVTVGHILFVLTF